MGNPTNPLGGGGGFCAFPHANKEGLGMRLVKCLPGLHLEISQGGAQNDD